jgi:predicted O-methyltransferase YrrM
VRTVEAVEDQANRLLPALPQKIRTLTWFLRRPPLYSQLAREIEARIRPPYGSRAEPDCREWCEKRALEPDDAIESITASPVPYLVEERFEAELAAAWVRAERARAAEPEDMPPAGHAELNLVYWLAERLKAERVIETGVAYGWSSLVLLLSLRERPGARLVSTDVPLRRTSGAYIGSAVPDELRRQWTLIEGLDRKVLSRCLEMLGGIDLCHYDSDKSYEGRAWAYPILWAALETGGLFISDDVDDNSAFRDFAHAVDTEPVIVAAGPEHYRKFVGVLAKRD